MSLISPVVISNAPIADARGYITRSWLQWFISLPTYLPTSISSLASLRNTVGAADGQNIIVNGFATEGDGGWGVFYWNAVSTAADDGGTIIAPAGVTTGRWYRENYINYSDVAWFGAQGNGNADSAAFTSAANSGILVSCGQSGYIASDLSAPPSSAISSWIFTNQPDARPIGTGGLINGPFSNFPSASSVKTYGVNTKTQPASGESELDLAVYNLLDNDITAYSSAAFVTTNAFKVYISGESSNGVYSTQQTKNIVGLDITASANTGGANISSTNGVSGITIDAFQYGTGICSNEFAVHNPAAGAGGQGQSVSMAAVQAIMYNDYGSVGAGHAAHCFLAVSPGVNGASSGYGLGAGTYNYALHLDAGTPITINNAAILMPLQAGSGTSGSQIVYKSNWYTQFDKTGNIFEFVANSSHIVQVTSAGINISASPATNSGTFLFMDACTASKSHIHLTSGTDASSSTSGDIWFNGTNLKMNVAGTVKTII